jgi:hypothetical protein
MELWTILRQRLRALAKRGNSIAISRMRSPFTSR